MAIDLYQTTKNPVSGETFRCVSFNKDAFVMEWIVQPKGYVPFEHIHLNQDEVFFVRSGEIKIRIDGKEHIAKKGEMLIVPKGAKHIAYNNTEEVLDCLVEYRPGLDHDKFMQCFTGLIQDGDIDKKGGIHIPKMGYFLIKMKAQCLARPTEIPAPAFNIALRVFYVRGLLSGWGSLFKKYTGI